MTQASQVEREMLALINQERTSRGLTPVELETRLNKSAEDHSGWMLSSDSFSHTGQNGSSAHDRMKDAGFEFSGNWRSGENIAWQSERGAPGLSDDVVDLHRSLMNSPQHRANILNPDFKYVGIGIEYGDLNGWDAVVVTQNFAATDAPVVLDVPSAPAPQAPAPATPAPAIPVVEAPEANTPQPEGTEQIVVADVPAPATGDEGANVPETGEGSGPTAPEPVAQAPEAEDSGEEIIVAGDEGEGQETGETEEGSAETPVAAEGDAEDTEEEIVVAGDASEGEETGETEEGSAVEEAEPENSEEEILVAGDEGEGEEPGETEDDSAGETPGTEETELEGNEEEIVMASEGDETGEAEPEPAFAESEGTGRHGTKADAEAIIAKVLSNIARIEWDMPKSESDDLGDFFGTDLGQWMKAKLADKGQDMQFDCESIAESKSDSEQREDMPLLRVQNDNGFFDFG
ncbi:CAP domain-containing protein [Ruegeria sediminis]|uniref:CAP domain-containing protein n=1 Tax=Ruegeria sediminis TaxID=2583820 RepID=A0ABY2WSW1_9RHOB|nr:CAP domain-containing protein [Ruegeria sediminis]TMV03785.1 CAP domain-containing protein [Ruegeria sediminis]